MSKISDLELREKIGKGAFSEVFKGSFKGYNKLVAVKILTKFADCIKEEISYLESFHHPNIIHFYGTIETDKLIIVTEYMDCTLDDLLYNQHSLKESLQFELTQSVKTFISIEIGKGIKYLQQQSLIHGDIKPENILINSSLKVKLSDFGLTKKPIECSDSIHGTPNYLPPETFIHNEYNLTCDIYAYSFVIWQIFTQRLLFVDYTTFDVLKLKIINGERPRLTSSVPKCYHKLLTKMWSKDVNERPPINDILIKLSENYLEEFSTLTIKNQWRMLCKKYYDGIIQREIPLEIMNEEHDFSKVFRNIDNIAVNHYDFLSTIFGDMTKDENVKKMNCFLSSFDVSFNWDERYLLVHQNQGDFAFIVREDLWNDDWLEVENIKSGKKRSMKNIYYLIN